MTVYLVMGVSGCGKSTLGRALADRIGAPFLEGDAYHPPENVARMAAGLPLDDGMRAPWLDLSARAGQGHVVLACSALKRAYRDRLRQAAPGLVPVFLDPPRAVLAEWLHHRRGHFMPESLLDSQYDTLEPPGPDEGTVHLTKPEPADEMVDRVVEGHPPGDG